ncbi:MAG: exo-beta-N-acetylmuramidase NamZ domain-containing protein [Candidatus Aminicenantales bacterium]
MMGMRLRQSPQAKIGKPSFLKIRFPGKVLIFSLILILLASISGCKGQEHQKIPIKKTVKLGLEVFMEKHLDLVKGKRVGLITNPSGIDSHLQSTAELFYQNSGINLVALYGPEHGVRGNAQAGQYVPFYVDERYHLPVFSLYGQSRRPELGMLKNIDEYMRSFDTQIEGKIPKKRMVRNIEVMVFDIQDVGTRIYTYIATMAYAMETCARNNIEFIVLDRPNPINGLDIEGPLLEYPQYSSFVGLYPIPVRHGLTAGELARLFNDRFLKEKVKLQVILMEGWRRQMWYDQTGLPWVSPSPNMPTLTTATVYPGQVFLEGTNVSEGRGTTKPFELFGAPWIDGYELAKKLNGLHLAGVAFREAWFTPTFSKYQGKLCGGAQIYINDRKRYKPLATTLHIIKTIKDLYPDKFKFHEEYFDKIMGTPAIRKALESELSIQQITDSYRQQIDNFKEMRKPFLLY